ncbi:DUF4402 domain-containing protein [Massilia sp. PAMC28688]|uniref:DUF4402 domain-containing protein n=1 Tax=Massilia sp. PAMC28688 TaxID=2861283 RepID=UPI001C6348E9|nr:DUF4402 domain-containing protein [Massilia sp. PAMC28688]QYF93426.1 DUF4402 domain-containing protein [Massilia sp. PAMC28688]
MNTTRRGAPARALAVLAALALLPPPVAAGPNVPPKHITTSANLSFGRFAAAGGGTISVNVNGGRTRTGSVVLLLSSASAARFNIGSNSPGNENRAYILTLPPNGVVALASGSNRMAVNNFLASGPAGGTLPSGTQSVSVGATLQVAPNQPRGNYTGIFQVTLEYQ